MHGVEVRLLGPVEVLAGGRAVEPGPVQQRTVLAALAVDAGRLVPLEVLIDRVWGDAPPPSVRSGIYSHIARLRRMLVPAGGLLRRPGGYLLDVPPEAVDLHRFRALSQAARAGPAPDAGKLGTALDLWRGPALAGLAGDWVAATRERLGQQRVEAVLAWAQALLAAGQPGPVIGTLRDFVDQHPLVEPLAARLIEALYASGRAAEALDCYARVRAHLAAELGAEPGPALRQLHQAVLRGDELGPSPAAAVVTPDGVTPDLVTSPLPPDTGAFTGRASQVRQIAGAVGDGPLPVMVIHAIAGMPGVGKTALAVHVAHRMAGRFPDGLVFVDLHGHTAGREPAAPADVLATLLSADGTDPRQLPAGLDARSALWRQRLAGRRLLLVLDNAVSSAQVAPLLPAAPGCLVLVTSRRFLGDLPGDTMPVQLDVLSPAEAAQMFRRLAGHPAAAEPDRVADLVAACGYLPLAISLLARVLIRHPRWTAGDLLAETRARLLTVTSEQASVAAAFGLSYQDLPAGRQRFFRQLAGHPGTVIEPYAAAALAGLPVPEAAAHLDALHADSLLIEVGYRRYVLHDLIRSYAGDLAAADPEGERAAALGRLLDFYQAAGARTAARLARQTRPAPPGARPPGPPGARPPGPPGDGLPDLADAARALSWARAERASLVACLAGTDDPRRVVSLTAALTELLRRDGPWTDAGRLARRRRPGRRAARRPARGGQRPYRPGHRVPAGRGLRGSGAGAAPGAEPLPCAWRPHRAGQRPHRPGQDAVADRALRACRPGGGTCPGPLPRAGRPAGAGQRHGGGRGGRRHDRGLPEGTGVPAAGPRLLPADRGPARPGLRAADERHWPVPDRGLCRGPGGARPCPARLPGPRGPGRAGADPDRHRPGGRRYRRLREGGVHPGAGTPAPQEP